MNNQWQKLLTIFNRLPKPNINPTFMDICQMGGDRFEERCSQVLRFYFSPDAPHKLRGLFINSLLEHLNLIDNPDFRYDITTTKVLTEEATEDRKRIDITIVTDNFVIAIENKIWADLYNPLESYTKHISDKYAGKKHIYIVLSVRKITSTEEQNKMADNGFVYVNYQDLFSAIKRNLGSYVVDCDQTYLTFLFDFIRTIEKKYNLLTMEQDRFFFENQDALNELVKHYDAFKQKILSNQIDRISAIKSELSEKTGANWWVWQGWDLGISFNEEGNRIGIECSFTDESQNNPIGFLHIYITVWSKKCFAPYENELRSIFRDAPIDYESIPNRVYLHLPVIDSNNHTEIIDKLTEYYNTMKELTDRIK